MSTNKQLVVYEAIESERDYQDRKWGGIGEHPRQSGGNGGRFPVAQQALHVLGQHMALDGVAADHPLRLHRFHVGKVGTIGAVNRDAFATGHEADYRIGRRRFATPERATGECRL